MADGDANTEPTTDTSWMEEWEKGEYRDADYVEGSHPMDNDGSGVTYHHVWPQPPAVDEESAPPQ
jgi:hypothetical protein